VFLTEHFASSSYESADGIGAILRIRDVRGSVVSLPSTTFFRSATSIASSPPNRETSTLSPFETLLNADTSVVTLTVDGMPCTSRESIKLANYGAYSLCPSIFLHFYGLDAPTLSKLLSVSLQCLFHPSSTDRKIHEITETMKEIVS